MEGDQKHLRNNKEMNRNQEQLNEIRLTCKFEMQIKGTGIFFA